MGGHGGQSTHTRLSKVHTLLSDYVPLEMSLKIIIVPVVKEHYGFWASWLRRAVTQSTALRV